ncbi:hypothetical protein DV515_00019389, partial [Chloebia gouldiae]
PWGHREIPEDTGGTPEDPGGSRGGHWRTPGGHRGTPGDVPARLTALSPQETDQLEEEKAELESEIAELRKEKERLEFVLVAHAPACKVPFEDIGAAVGPQGPAPEGATCGASHQRSSSSDQSSDSLNSPSLLAL